MSLVRRSLLTATLAAAAAATLSAGAMAWGQEQVKGDGKIVKEARQLESFDGIALAGPFELKLRQSDTQRVELEADSNLLPLVETRVVSGSKGKTLEVQVKKGYSVYSKQPLRIAVDAATLRRLAIAGSGKAEIDALKTDKVDFSVAGAGTVVAPQLDAGTVKMSVAGAGDIRAGGKATELDVSIAGSGDVKAFELAGDEVKVSIAGSGDAQVQANKKLKVSIAGSGDVVYTGSAEPSTSIAGSGSVKRR